MYSKSHLAISAAVGGVLAVWTGAAPARAAFLVAYAGLLGTAIDLDHFLVARLRAGDWRHLRSAVTSPRVAFVDQDELFEEGAVGPQTRLLSHALIAGLLVGGFAVVDPFLAALTGLVLYVHVVCDLIAGVREYEPLAD
jgi:hypothetical protein